MNKIKKTKAGEDIYYNGHVAKKVKRGDIILRPIIPKNLLDRLINKIMPGDFEHGMVYLGDGKLLNPYPDKKTYIHKEDIFDNFNWYSKISLNPKILTFARITKDSSVIENFILSLQKESRCNKHSYCTSTIIDSFVRAGIPAQKFKAKNLKENLATVLFVNIFKTGYEISLAAEKIFSFEKIK